MGGQKAGETGCIGVGEQGKGEPAVLQGAGDTVLPQQAGRPGVVGGAQGQAGATAGVERGQGVLKHQPPLPDDAHVVGHLVDLAEQVAGHHHRHAEPAGQGADELPHLLDARRIQAVGGLVQDQQPGEAQQGGG